MGIFGDRGIGLGVFFRLLDPFLDELCKVFDQGSVVANLRFRFGDTIG